MKIQKIINNNIVSSVDENGHEILLMGRGIGFHGCEGDVICMEKVEKTFRIENPVSMMDFKQLVVNMPLEHLEISNDIISYAEVLLDVNLNQNVYITLTDHISFAIERCKKNATFSYPFKWGIQQFYPKEYQVGEYALELLRKKLGARFTDDEAAIIAMHFVNAEYNLSMPETVQVTAMMHGIIAIVDQCYGNHLNRDSIHWKRFVTHVKYMVVRLLQGEQLHGDDIFHREPLEQCQEELLCSKKIASYILQNYDIALAEEEIFYLTIYIRRVRIRGDA